MIPKRAREDSSGCGTAFFIIRPPLNILYLLIPEMINTQLILRLVISNQYTVLQDINCLASYITSVDLVDRGLRADVPEVYSFVPSSAEEHVWIKWVPFYAIYSVSMRSDASDLEV